MSYNVSTVVVISNKDFRISAGDLRALHDQFESDLPEQNWISDNLEEAEGVSPDEVSILIETPWWIGGWSGNSIDTMVAALKRTRGKIEFVLVWENGDNFDGYRVSDGNVERVDVQLKLMGG